MCVGDITFRLSPRYYLAALRIRADTWLSKQVVKLIGRIQRNQVASMRLEIAELTLYQAKRQSEDLLQLKKDRQSRPGVH